MATHTGIPDFLNMSMMLFCDVYDTIRELLEEQNKRKGK